MGISYSSTGSTLKIRFRYKGGNLETVWIAYWKGGYLAKIPREGGTWKSGIPKGGNLAFSLIIVINLRHRDVFCQRAEEWNLVMVKKFRIQSA